MGSDVVGELGIVLDLMDDADHFRRNFLVELDVAFELVNDRARHRLGLDLLAHLVGKDDGFGLIVICAVAIFLHARTRGALDQHLHGAVGQLEQLQNARQRTHLVDGVGRRIVVGSILLRREQNVDVRTHDLLQRADRLFATHKQGNDHVREHHDVAQRQHRIGSHLTGRRERARL